MLNCKHLNEEIYCAHVLAVAVNQNIVEDFVKHLEKQKAPSPTVSTNIDKSQVWKKKTALILVPVAKKLSKLHDHLAITFNVLKIEVTK